MTEPIVLTQASPVTRIPGPASDQGDDAVARLRARQAQLRAELDAETEIPAPIAHDPVASAAWLRNEQRRRELAAERAAAPPAAAVVTGTVAVRAPSAVRTTGSRTEISGAGLLGYVCAFHGQYASYPSPAAQDAAAIWALHSHVRDSDGRLAFRATPRLACLSAEPGSGKSRVLELQARLCPFTFGLDTEPTAAGLAHTLSAEHATVLLDEAERSVWLRQAP